MVQFTVKLAGLPVAVRALYPSTQKKFRDYLTDEQPQITIGSDEEKLLAERRLMKELNKSDAGLIDAFPDCEIESNYLYRETAEQLSRYAVVLLHGSAVSVDDDAYVFVAPSGVGKSTHARIWCKTFGNRAVMINDDKPLLRCSDGALRVYGSPWNGKHRLGSNVSAPLKAICFLERGESNRIKPISASEAFVPLLKSIYHSKNKEHESFILQSLQTIRQTAAFYRLSCNMEPDAAAVSFEGMKNGNCI